MSHKNLVTNNYLYFNFLKKLNDLKIWSFYILQNKIINPINYKYEKYIFQFCESQIRESKAFKPLH